MKALILAAGFGTRLKPFTLHHPKPMVPVKEIPLLIYTLAFLKHAGLKEIIINLHHKGDQIQKFLGNGKALGLHIRYSNEKKILGTGGGIKKVMPLIDDDLLIINGDILVDFDLRSFIKTHKKQKKTASLLLLNHPQKKKYGLLHQKDHQIVSVLGEPVPLKGSQNGLFTGIHIINKKKIAPLFKPYKQGDLFCIMKDIYRPLLSDKSQTNLKNPLAGDWLDGLWCVNDSLVDVKKTEKRLKHHKLSYEKTLRSMTKKLIHQSEK